VSQFVKQHIAVFGPTGYIGTKLIIELYNTGYRLSLFSRSIRKLSYLQDDCTLLSYQDTRVCIIEQFLEEQNFDQLCDSLQGVDAVYYLVHSLGVEKNDFLNKDNELAAFVAKAASVAGVKQIIYLGGLGVDSLETPLSKHLKSRQLTGDYLRRYHDCVTEFRAGVIIGAGSASFEIIRSLGIKLPFIPSFYQPEGLCQPIFVDDVIAYLNYALFNQQYYNKIAEIGSEDIFKYSEMVKIFAKMIAHKNLQTIPLPLINRLFTPQVISWFITGMTQMPYILVERLIEGMSCNAIIDKYPVSAIEEIPHIKPLNYYDSIRIATIRTEGEIINSVWSTPYEISVLNAKQNKQFLYLSSKEIDGMLYEEYSKKVKVDEIGLIFETIKDIGGKKGYFSPKWLWSVRGFIDKIIGGPGLSSYKVSKKFIRVGSKIDFWVVTYYKDWRYEKILRLKAKMKAPGNAWLQFTLKTSQNKEDAVFTLRAYFEPSGIFGYLYWYSLYFIHKFIFRTMVNNIIKKASEGENGKEKNVSNTPLKL
jgi:uncharacterized protein YbjT (DUF2867 family)